MYPIPTQDYITVETILTSEGNPVHQVYPINGTAEVQTIQGKTIFKFEVSQPKTQLDISTLSTGIYLLVLNINNQKKVYKIERVY